MSRVETAIAPTSARAAIRLSRSLTDFINEIKADQNVLCDLILFSVTQKQKSLRHWILQRLHQKRFDLIRSLNLFE
ncbi:hypothetical protein ACFX1Q_014983 [Malus domestica]